jgi:hypothetical protein
MHWGVFIQSDEPVMEPLERLRQAAPNHSARVALESVGQTWTLKQAADNLTAPRPGN